MQGYGSAPAYGASGYKMDSEDGFGGKSPFSTPQPRTSARMVIACIVLPWIVYAAVYCLNSTSINFSSPDLVKILSTIMLLLIQVIAYAALMAWWRRAPGVLQIPAWYSFLYAACLIAWYVSGQAGNINFINNVAPYMELNRMNVYSNVDPWSARGQKLMDMGQIHFNAGSHLDLTKSIGFRNSDIFCVAPIVSANTTASTRLETYDLWAIGLNCCSGHVPDFHCGEFNVANAVSGVRLLRDDQRAYFRLAVKQAEAAYNIVASHPIFMYWMVDPTFEINAYADTAAKVLLTNLLASFVVFLFLGVFATVLITNHL